MQYTLESLMAAVGCPRWPERWHEIFGAAMAEYDAQGCFLANEAFYDRLQETYHCFPKYLAEFKAAARQTASDEALGRFLTLLAMATRDRGHIMQDAVLFDRPVTPEGKEPLGYDMVCGLALCGVIEYAAAQMQSRGVPQEHIDASLCAVTNGVAGHIARYNGRAGYDLFGWSQLYIDGKIFYFDGLGLEIGCDCGGQARVYQNAEGEQIILADDVRIHRSGYALGSAGCTDEEGAFTAEITETDTQYIGHPVLPDGRTDTETVAIEKAQWQLLLGPDTPTLGLHINRGADFSPAAVEERLDRMCRFLDAYYPEIQPRIFTCISWLLDPQMQSFLNENSNIVHFQKRFRCMPRVCNGKGVFFFIYAIPNEQEPDLDALETKSSLQAGIVSHYKAGKYIYELPGYFVARSAEEAALS